MKKHFLITTPIYYASGNLHIGHLYTTTLAWVIGNYKKIRGYEVNFLTGSDEHGSKIAQKAKEAGLSPQEFVDQLDKKYKQMWVDFGIDYDLYSRTTNPEHIKRVQHIFSYFLEKGFIYKGQYQGLYSVSDEEFLTETQAIKKDNQYFHPTSGHKLEWVSEESYFFKMSTFQDWLLEYMDKHPDWVAPEKIKNEIKNNFLFKGLEDLSLSRTNVKWGIEILENRNHTLYVWLDALCNYITALDYDVSQEKQSSSFVNFWEKGEVVHLLGKEITRFHVIYWPIFLKALGLKQPTKIQSHGWIVTSTGKMSKSKNNVVDPYELLSKYDKEMIKYFFASQISLGEDGIFEEQRFIDVINADLVNNFGNLVSRTLKMYSNSFARALKYEFSSEIEDQNIDNMIISSVKEFTKHLDSFAPDKGFKVAMHLSSELNKYIDNTKPWTLKDNLRRLEQILVRLLNGIYAVNTFLSPVLALKSKEVIKALGKDTIDFEEILNFEKFNNTVPLQSFILLDRKSVV